MSLIDIIATSIWLMIPAYIANPTAAVFGGGRPMDFGKNFYDGRRILGDGKTYRGLIGGTLCGIAAGSVQIISTTYVSSLGVLKELTIFQSALGAYSTSTIHIVFLMSLGALLGDSAESFIKRRLNLKRGAMFPVADQLDFVLGAWLLTYIFASVWFRTYFTPAVIITALVVTPLLHVAANVVGYVIKVKKEPW